jgi:hypothetical protein
MASSRSERTIRRACEAEKMPCASAGGEPPDEAVGLRRRWTALSRWRREPLLPSDDERRWRMAELISMAAILSMMEFSASEPADFGDGTGMILRRLVA